ncbi:MAG: ComF family protein [Clostridia bacterium]|nr:ComF family protein [Clostridia bacterium]
MSKNILSVISRLIFPPKCIVCGELLYESENEPLCNECRKRISFIESRPKSDGQRLQTVSAVSYLPPIRNTLVSVKSHESTYKIKGLCLLAAQAARTSYKSSSFDLIAVVPSSEKSVRRVGFDRMDTYGRALSRELKIKYDKNAIKKIRETKKQHTLSAKERLTAQKGAFSASPTVRGKRVLLFDDIVTTGATLNECAAALKAAGAADVRCLTVAKTPQKG